MISLLTYICLHLLGKIDLVRSKLGLGFTAVITVLFSLTMSLGICTFLGLSITVSGRYEEYVYNQCNVNY